MSSPIQRTLFAVWTLLRTAERRELSEGEIKEMQDYSAEVERFASETPWSTNNLRILLKAIRSTAFLERGALPNREAILNLIQTLIFELEE